MGNGELLTHPFKSGARLECVAGWVAAGVGVGLLAARLCSAKGSPKEAADSSADHGASSSPGGTNIPPFHLAFPVHDLAAARAFYGDLLGCMEGRSSAKWVDYNLAGHQIVCHWVGWKADNPDLHTA
jgi:hypothetical protein